MSLVEENVMKKDLYVYPGVTSEQLEALKDEVLDFMVLGTQDIDNTDIEIDDNDCVLVKQGTLLHGTKYSDRKKDTEKLNSIAANGIITGEFFGAKEKGRTHYHAEFYRANKDMSLKEFLKDDREYFPKKDNSIVAFLIVEGESVKELFKNNSLASDSNVTDEIRSLVEGGLVYHKEELEDNSVAAIPIGIPANCFSAIVVSDDIAENQEQLDHIHQLFNNLSIINTKGQVIVERVVSDNE